MKKIDKNNWRRSFGDMYLKKTKGRTQGEEGGGGKKGVVRWIGRNT